MVLEPLFSTQRWMSPCEPTPSGRNESLPVADSAICSLEFECRIPRFMSTKRQKLSSCWMGSMMDVLIDMFCGLVIAPILVRSGACDIAIYIYQYQIITYETTCTPWLFMMSVCLDLT